MRPAWLEVSAAAAGALIVFFWPLDGAVALSLAAALPVLGTVTVRAAESRMLRHPVALDRYWPDASRDALERYAAYWLYPGPSRGLALAVRMAAALMLGAALPLLFFNWAVSAVFLVFAGWSRRQARLLDPVTWYQARAAAKDFSAAEEWESVMDVRDGLKKEGSVWAEI